MDIATLRKSRSSNFAKITSEFEKIVNPQSGVSFEDGRYWKLERDKAGNGSAVIRFLQSTDDNELPWVRIFSHGFKGPTGRWYIENSLTTLGEDDPVGELNAKLWNSGSDSDKKIAQERKRRLGYVSNILVISDPKHPENEGRVFLFKYGKKIFDILMDKARPTFEDDTPMDVFDYWGGANLKLRIRQDGEWPSYDKSTFDEQRELFDGDDEKILVIANKQYPLKELLDRKYFKTYEELSRKLNSILETGSDMTIATSIAERVIAPPEIKSAPAPAFASGGAEEDDIMSYFQSIANED